MADSKFATRGIVLNGCHGGFDLSKRGKEFLIQNGMSQKMVREIENSDDMSVRMNPLLVALVRKHPELFNGFGTSLYVVEVPVDAIMADAVSISEYDGIEDESINEYKVTLWKKNPQSILFDLIVRAISNGTSKAAMMPLLEEFKKTISEPMPSKPVPGILPLP